MARTSSTAECVYRASLRLRWQTCGSQTIYRPTEEALTECAKLELLDKRRFLEINLLN